MIFSSFIVSCKSYSSNDESISSKSYVGDSYAPSTESAEEKQSSNNDINVALAERKLIKEADLSWETNNMKKSHELVIAQVKAFNGFISNDNQYKDDYQYSNDMVAKIPADKFDEFLKSIQKEVKYFDRKDIRTIDVTEEYIDVDARIRTKKELEQRYLEILKKANSVEDIMSVEAQLNEVRNEIESAEGRMKVLNNQISLSTVRINFYEITSAPVGFFGKIGKSFIDGWNFLLKFMLDLITLWPFILLGVIIIYFIIKRRRKRLN